METIFLSYVREDESDVARLAEDLRSKGAQVWRDRESIAPGDEWEKAIRAAIRNGAYFVPCFSRNYAARSETYMNDELRAVCGRSQSTDRADNWLLPVNLDGCIVPTFTDELAVINQVNHVHMHPSWDEGVSRLAEATVKITKKKVAAQIRDTAERLVELDFQLFKAEQELDRAWLEHFKREALKQRMRMLPFGMPTQNEIGSSTELDGANERVGNARARREAAATTYQSQVAAFLERYGEEYYPYGAMNAGLEARKQAHRQERHREEVAMERGERLRWLVPTGIFVVALAVMLVGSLC